MKNNRNYAFSGAKNKSNSRMVSGQAFKLVFSLGIVLILCMIFFFIFSTKASADSGDLTDIRGYEQILVRSGDTLDGLAAAYAPRLSHVSAAEYKSQIVRLNNLASDYLREGVYLMMPVCLVEEPS